MYNRSAILAAALGVMLAAPREDSKERVFKIDSIPEEDKDIMANNGVRRVTAESKQGRQLMARNQQQHLSNNKPHIGLKQIHKGHKQLKIHVPNCKYCQDAIEEVL